MLLLSSKTIKQCEKRIKSKKLVTIDHIVPQDFGGPTISNNLIPSCSKCNKEKGNMTKEEYDEFKRSGCNCTGKCDRSDFIIYLKQDIKQKKI